MLMYICGHCGKSNPVGERCSCRAKADAERNKRYDRECRNHARTAFYQSIGWERCRQAVKARANGMDQYAYNELHMIQHGTTAHHIIPFADDPARAFDMDNLIWVSAQMHRRIHATYDRGPEAKRALQDRLRAIIHPGGGSKSF